MLLLNGSIFISLGIVGTVHLLGTTMYGTTFNFFFFFLKKKTAINRYRNVKDTFRNLEWLSAMPKHMTSYNRLATSEIQNELKLASWPIK